MAIYNGYGFDVIMVENPLPDNNDEDGWTGSWLMYGMMDAAATGEDYEPEEEDED